MPEVTVLMPVFNGAEFLTSSIESILNQTFLDFEFLIINDGSTDATKDIILSYSDNRIRYVENTENLGLINTLNNGIKISKGTFIVRMDADDISLPLRIEKQVLFMKQNPEIDILGTWFSLMDTDTNIYHPISNEECQVKLLQNTVIGHPTVLIKRKSIIKKSLEYHSDSIYAEDYRLWTEASLKKLSIANFPEVLLSYRKHNKQISFEFKNDQLRSVDQIRLWYGKNYFGNIVEKEADLYLKFLNKDIVSIKLYYEIKNLSTTLKEISKIKYPKNQTYLDSFFNDLLNYTAKRCYQLCIDCKEVNLFSAFSDKRFYHSTTFTSRVKFILKSLI